MKKILLVDDRQENLYLLNSLLTGNGYLVEQATNGEEALQLARQQQPDMIVADVLMPVMDGFELCHNIRNDKSLKNTAFVFYTASYLDQRDKNLAENLGVDRYLLKPQEPADLLRIFKEVLDQRERSETRGINQKPLHEKQYLREHNESLIRMLEKKIEELNRSREVLKDEILVRKQTEEKLKASLREKEVLLKEVYHRTKNNMQVILALFDLQQRKLSDVSTKEVFQKMSARIYSMSMVHDLLYRSKNLYEIHLDDYVTKLTQRLLSVYNTAETTVDLELDLAATPLNIQFAVPLGQVINEIVCNSMKYAFKGKSQGRIYLSSRQANEQFILIIGDDGIGMQNPEENQSSNTLGAYIIRAVVENQLFGRLAIDDHPVCATR
jgi:two-component sensor histidine kinase/ActR/RegA family two-component response regulator